VSYVRSIFLASDKDAFDVARYDLDALARSFGLAGVPSLRFVKGASKDKNVSYKLKNEEGAEENQTEKERPVRRWGGGADGAEN
jgi:hypothetical protein